MAGYKTVCHFHLLRGRGSTTTPPPAEKNRTQVLQLLFIDTQVGTIATGLEMLHSRMEVESAGCDCSDS